MGSTTWPPFGIFTLLYGIRSRQVGLDTRGRDARMQTPSPHSYVPSVPTLAKGFLSRAANARPQHVLSMVLNFHIFVTLQARCVLSRVVSNGAWPLRGIKGSNQNAATRHGGYLS